jgi:3-oxoacyl-[acyl-carrier protein] reductase
VLRGLAEADVPAEFTFRTSAERARELEAALKQRGHALEAREPGAIRRLCASLESEGRTPDVVVHCLGVGQDRALADISEEDWEMLHAINVRSAFLAIQALAGPMAARGGGDIVLTAAFDGSRPMPAPAHFAATQGALCAMVRSLSKELGPKGIRVNAVNPGPVATEGFKSAGIEGSEFETQMIQGTPLGRIGQPEDIAAVVAFIASDDARWVTGSLLQAAGGMR